MANKMLIDATHPEETRVVVVRGNRVEEFDYESATRKQLRGNIYLAKVTRVEPSLQAAFIEYGGNRHGFLAFSEIHPDYYQIPVADRLALIEEEERAARLADDEADIKERRRERGRSRRSHPDQSVSAPVAPAAAFDAGEAVTGELPAGGFTADAATPPADGSSDAAHSEDAASDAPQGDASPSDADQDDRAPQVPAEPMSALVAPAEAAEAAAQLAEAIADAPLGTPLPAPQDQAPDAMEALRRREAEAGESDPAPILDGDDALSDDDEEDEDEGDDADEGEEAPRVESRRPADTEDDEDEDDDDSDVDQIDEDEEIENIGAEEDAMEEVPERAPQRRARSYKIQEVIRRRQVMLVQVVKEERGNKGAALTTYLSLAGRYSVLMPNTARGGGISRKITNAVDRKRLKDVVQDLEVPEGMGIILRTAGANRTKTEIKRDFEYLLRLWETVRELTLSSAAPSLVYEEGSLIKRAIRDLYNKDIDEVHVAGEEGYREAKDFMRMLMPSHAKSVLPYREPQPIFARYGVEQQLDAMFSPVVQLKSGGYIVINPTEALVSIDVNSGRATREHHIEDTALKTNMEASEEIARQLRLRDLAGLIVIDFIDMEEKRNNRSVERKIKDCLKNDRARIQIGRISHFGLLEMSRQRIRTGVLESSIEVCPHCGGTGHVRSAASVSLQLLRALEEQLLRAATHNLIARTRTEVALYVLNQKRAHLRELEERFTVTLAIAADESVTGHQPFIIEKGDLAAPPPAAPRPSSVVQPDSILLDEDFVEEDEDEVVEESEAEVELAEAPEPAEANGERDDSGRRRRRRRRRRKGEREDGREAAAEGEEDDESTAEAEESEGEDDDSSDEEPAADAEPTDEESAERRRRRRGRRGGRRNRREREGEGEGDAPLAAEADAERDEDAEDVPAATTGAPETVEPMGERIAEPLAAPLAELRVEVKPAHPSVPAAEAPARAAPAPAPEPIPEASETTRRRRRSTVREKAPAILGPDVAPAQDAPVQDSLVQDNPVQGTLVQDTPAPESAVRDSQGHDAEAAAQMTAQPTEAATEVPPEARPVSDDAPAAEAPSPAVDDDASAAAPDDTKQSVPAGKPRSGWWQRKLFGG